MAADEMSDAVRNDACFAAAGARQNQQRAFSVINGFALLGIEALQEIHLMGVCLNSIMVTCSTKPESSSSESFSIANHARLMSDALHSTVTI